MLLLERNQSVETGIGRCPGATVRTKLRTWRGLMMDASGSTVPGGLSTTATSGSGR